MADNTTITPGAGVTIATDDVSGAHYQKMKLFDGTADSTNAAIVDSSGRQLVLASGSGTFVVGGPQGSGANITGNPLNNGFRGTTINPTAVTNGQSVHGMADKLGRQVVVNEHFRDLRDSQATTITTSTSTTVVTAGGASVFTDITAIGITNSSPTAVVATLSDGTKSYSYAIAAGGGFVQSFTVARKASSANTAWTVTSSAAVTSLYVNIDYVKNL